MVVRRKMYSPNSVNKIFPTQQNTKARSFSKTIFHMKTSPLLTNRKSPIPRVTEDIKISCSWNGVFVKQIALDCQSKTLKVASKFQSPKLNFQPHWRQAGRNFGAPKKYGRGGVCYQVSGSQGVLGVLGVFPFKTPPNSCNTILSIPRFTNQRAVTL